LVKTLRVPNFIKKKVTLIYNGIKDETYKKLPKLSTGSNVKHIVSLGELNDNKHHKSVISILPQIKNVHYHIIGEGGQRSKLEKLIKDKKLEKRVTLYGHVNNAKDLLSQYDVFLLPSKTEALGYVVLEALQAGLPVIARAVGGVPEILKGLSYGKLYKYDTDLIDLLTDEVHKDFKWKDSRFDFEKMIEKTLYLYK
jgi:glycosyltransferase involved in cell wall biosynthesis